MRIPDTLVQRLKSFQQDHVLEHAENLPPNARADFVRQLEAIDFAELDRLYREQHQASALPELHQVAPLPRTRIDSEKASNYEGQGEAAFSAGKVAFLVVAGGQGTRLGFDRPKGLFEIGPVSEKSLFQIHCEKILALSRRHGQPLPLLVMTSDATDEETRSYFANQDYFGLAADDVWFFRQGTMPALDAHTGKVLIEAPGKLALSPNGHGGTLTGLAESGLLDRLERQRIRTVYYFQVDNPLIHLGDVLFLGQHLDQDAEVSSKVVVKRSPDERVGNFVCVDGRCAMIEYSDLDRLLAQSPQPDFAAKFWAGNPAIHLFDVAFLRRMTQTAEYLPWHIASKPVPYLTDAGELVTPTEKNALKFERFIFDILPHAERWSIWEIDRDAEFHPLKNAEGSDSPATVRRAIIEQAADWLEKAGVKVPRDASGTVIHPVEISPLFALDPLELAAKVDPRLEVRKPLNLE